MKVLLIDPPGVQKGLNVGLGYLASSLKSGGHEVRVLDFNNGVPASIDIFKKEVGRFYPEVIGYSIKATTLDSALTLSRASHDILPEAVHIAGGPEITLFYEDFLKNNKHFDFAFVGDAERTICNVVNGIENDGNFSGIKGVSYRVAESIKTNSTFINDLDALPFPDFSSFSNIEETFRDVEYCYPLVTSRGCPYNCVFCSVGLVSGRRWRARSPENLISELRHAREEYGIREFSIVDDNFTLDVERAKTFCRMLIDGDGGFNFRFRLNNGIRTDRIDGELASLMYDAGCNLVMVGVESGDARVFKDIGKDEELEDVKRGIKILKEAGIWVGGYFIIGLPGDNKRSIENTVEFVKEVGLDHCHFNVLVPYPRTKAWEWVSKEGRFLKDYRVGLHFSDESWSVEPVFETDEFTATEMMEAYEMANTQLSQFNFLMPKDLNRMGRFKRKTKLIWKHDRASIPRRVLDSAINNVKSVLRLNESPAYSR